MGSSLKEDESNLISLELYNQSISTYFGRRGTFSVDSCEKVCASLCYSLFYEI